MPAVIGSDKPVTVALRSASGVQVLEVQADHAEFKVSAADAAERLKTMDRPKTQIQKLGEAAAASVASMMALAEQASSLREGAGGRYRSGQNARVFSARDNRTFYHRRPVHRVNRQRMGKRESQDVVRQFNATRPAGQKLSLKPRDLEASLAAIEKHYADRRARGGGA